MDLSSRPPFPDDIGPCAQLETLCLLKLSLGNWAEQRRLLEICRTKGFFFLNFTSCRSDAVPEVAKEIVSISQPLFKLTSEEKMSYACGTFKPHSLLGFKHSGSTQTDSTGTRDTAEFWNIGKDDVLSVSGSTRVPYPPALDLPKNRPVFADFQRNCHEIGLLIMSILAEKLGLPADAFADKHRLDKPSDDHIRITRGPPRKTADLPEIQTPGHTDFGLITILFNWLGGLQIWSEPSRGNFHQVFDGAQPQENGRDGEWLWVKPKPGLAIVNSGDAAVKFTGGLLCSARHRVVPAPGEQGLLPRYSVVYFVRPEDDALLKRLEGGVIPKVKKGEEQPEYTTREWIKKQYMQLQEGKGRQD